jgi:hypothetical protein
MGALGGGFPGGPGTLPHLPPLPLGLFEEKLPARGSGRKPPEEPPWECHLNLISLGK